MKKAALIVIYNHAYVKNILVIEKIYRDRFSHIFHLMPFYQGDRPNVIPVYNDSRYFQGYIASGFRFYFSDEYRHFIFIADDLLLNPVVNEDNYEEIFRLNGGRAFIQNIVSAHEVRNWNNASGFLQTCQTGGVETNDMLPTFEQAVAIFEKHGLSVKPISKVQAYRLGRIKKFLGMCLYKVGIMKPIDVSYPYVLSYSDICVVPCESIERFCHYCGVFAANNLFVEIALPTALVLSTDKIVQIKDLPFCHMLEWDPGYEAELKKYNKQLEVLLAGFPKNWLYVHPIKLSQWDHDGVHRGGD